jgi:hypothetical protein
MIVGIHEFRGGGVEVLNVSPPLYGIFFCPKKFIFEENFWDLLGFSQI